MRRQENVKSKTIRMDGSLVEAVEKVLSDDSQHVYSSLNFSEAVRYGLVLVLAAYGQSYQEPSAYNRMKITGSYRTSQTLSKATGVLLAAHETEYVKSKGRETA